jgi:membrane protein YqaA with SNARE-associated domain
LKQVRKDTFAVRKSGASYAGRLGAVLYGIFTVGVALAIAMWVMRDPSTSNWLRLLDLVVAASLGAFWGYVMGAFFARRRDDRKPDRNGEEEH